MSRNVETTVNGCFSTESDTFKKYIYFKLQLSLLKVFVITKCCRGSDFNQTWRTLVRVWLEYNQCPVLLFHTYSLFPCLLPSSNSAPPSKNLSALKRSLHSLFLWAALTSLLSSVTVHLGSVRAWAGCFTPHPQSERSVQLGWTPCLCRVIRGALVHLTQFQCHLSEKWAEAQRAVWRPLMAAESRLFPVHVKPKLV